MTRGVKQAIISITTFLVALIAAVLLLPTGVSAEGTKAKPTIPEPKLTFSELYYGEKTSACGIQNGWELPNSGNDSLTTMGENNIVVTLPVDSDNYDYESGLSDKYSFDKDNSQLTTTITITVKKVKPIIDIDMARNTIPTGIVSTITAKVTAKNPYNNATVDCTICYKIDDGNESDEIPVNNEPYSKTFEDHKEGQKITFIVRVAESECYEVAEAETFVVVVDGTCNHSYDMFGEYQSDECYHWKICTVCGAQVDKGKHNTGGSASCVSGAVCGQCNKAHGALDRNNHGLGYKKVDSEYHIKYCQNCGYEDSSSKTAHTLDSNSTCNSCGYQVLGDQLEITATTEGETLTYGTDYTYPKGTGVLTILSDKAVTIKNADGVTTTTDTIVVTDGVSANITLAGVNIDVSGTGDATTFTVGKAAFMIADYSTGSITITLADGTTNTLKSGWIRAGLQKNGEDFATGTLKIKGTGTLIAVGGEYGAGIGGEKNCEGSNITIENGTIIATGGKYGAGIGGGNLENGTHITISGGTVIATGGAEGVESGAGIGGGYRGVGSYITISGGMVTAKGGTTGGAGIGGGKDGFGHDIAISGGTVTATGGDNGAGIGGGESGAASYNIVITGGSVKAVAGTGANAIGGGSGSEPVIPTLADNTTPVYLLKIKNPNSDTITINNVTYPLKHVYYENGVEQSENTIYVYLPAKTATAPNVVTVGDKTTKCYYDTNKWVTVIEKPTEPTITEFTYNGSEQTYALAESEYYTISGNKQTNAGDYVVTVTLNENVVWSDGTSAPLTFDFIIKKASPVIDTPTATDITYGQSLSESTLTNGWSWDDGTVVPTAGLSQHYAVKTVTDDDNYDYESLANIAYNSNTHTIEFFTTINVNRATPNVMLSVDSGKAMPGSKVTLKVSMDNVVMSNLPSYSATYRVDSGTEEGFVNEFVIPADTPEGAVITITVETTESLNYNQVTKTASFTVSTCDHALLSEDWLFTPTTHYKKCQHCENAVNEANHTYNNDGYCTVCGYFDGAAVVTTATTTTKTTTTTTTTVEETTTTTTTKATTTAAKTTKKTEATTKKPAVTTTKSDNGAVDGVMNSDTNPVTGVTISFSAVILAGAVVIATKKKRK